MFAAFRMIVLWFLILVICIFFFFDKYVNFIIMAMVMTQRIQSDSETNPNVSRVLSKAEVQTKPQKK